MTDLGELVLEVLGGIAEFVWDLLPEGGRKTREDGPRPVPMPDHHERSPTPDTE